MTAQPDPKEQPELYPVADRLHALPGLADSRRQRRRARVGLALGALGFLVLAAISVLIFR
ncbi:MAG TPA: hypothetical protein VH743_02065 [Beijerinckiaceae bacterium]|jgi:hypothetical protein